MSTGMDEKSSVKVEVDEVGEQSSYFESIMVEEKKCVNGLLDVQQLETIVKEELLYNCDICQMSFATEKQLLSHKTESHIEVKQSLVDETSKETSQLENCEMKKEFQENENELLDAETAKYKLKMNISYVSGVSNKLYSIEKNDCHHLNKSHSTDVQTRTVLKLEDRRSDETCNTNSTGVDETRADQVNVDKVDEQLNNSVLTNIKTEYNSLLDVQTRNLWKLEEGRSDETNTTKSAAMDGTLGVKVEVDEVGDQSSYLVSIFNAEEQCVNGLLDVQQSETIVKEELLYNCDICEMSFITEKQLLSHKTKFHFENKQSLVELQAESSDKICNAKCSDVDETRCATVNVGKVDEQVDNSSLINAKREDNSLLDVQILGTTIVNNNGLHYCDICSESFTTIHKITLHMKEFHTMDAQTWSKKNSKKISKEILMEHNYSYSLMKNCLRTKTYKRLMYMNGKTYYQCNVCNKSFTRSSTLFRHLEVHKEKPKGHEQSSTYQCDICLRNFFCSSNLRRHMSHHGVVKMYECKLCNKKFTQKISLLIHKRSHAGENHDEGSSSSSGRVKHQMTDIGTPPYKCIICPKQFTTMPLLELHVINHLENPYMCNVCLRGFKTPAALNNHRTVGATQ